MSEFTPEQEKRIREIVKEVAGEMLLKSAMLGPWEDLLKDAAPAKETRG